MASYGTSRYGVSRYGVTDGPASMRRGTTENQRMRRGTVVQPVMRRSEVAPAGGAMRKGSG